MHIYIDPEFGRNHPLWSEGDNGDDINKYPFSDALLNRILAWDEYWHNHYLILNRTDGPCGQGWIESADVVAWINEGLRISMDMKKEYPDAVIENKFLSYGDR